MCVFPILQWRLGYSEIFNYSSQKKSSSTKNLPQVCLLLKLLHSYHCTDRIGEGISELNTLSASKHATKRSWTVKYKLNHKVLLTWSYFNNESKGIWRSYRSRVQSSEHYYWWEICESRDFPGGPVVKNPPSNAGDTSLIPGRGRFHVLWGN